MKIKHQYYLLVAAALICLVTLLGMGRVRFLEIVQENQMLVQQKLDPLIRKDFPELEREHRNIQSILDAESRLSKAFFAATKLYKSLSEGELSELQSTIQDHLGRSNLNLNSIESVGDESLGQLIRAIQNSHLEFKSSLEEFSAVSAGVVDELKERQKWREESEKRFDPFRQSLDELGERVGKAIIVDGTVKSEKLEQALSLILNADRDCYQCFMSESRVSENQDPEAFQKWMSFHQENSEQIVERLDQAKHLVVGLVAVNWDAVELKRDQWLQATQRVVSISELIHGQVLRKGQMFQQADENYASLFEELRDANAYIESKIELIGERLENQRESALAESVLSREKTTRFVWLFNGFLLLLLIFVAVLLWFPRRLVNHLDYVCEYLNRLGLKRLSIPFHFPKNNRPSKGSDMEKLAESINRMRLNLVEAKRERDLMIEKLHESRLQAQASAAAKEEFLSVMSHELRTPLNPILALSEILKIEVEDEDQLDSLEVIHASAVKLTTVIDSILEYSQMNKQEVDCALEFFDFQEVITHCCVGERARAVNAEILDFDLDFSETNFHPESGNALWIETDREMLRQVISLILNNAFKFTKQGFVNVDVTLECLNQEMQQATLRVKIADSGEGIPEEKIKQVFEPFFMADSSYNRPHQGVGLSLAMCDLVVKKLGGKLGCKSELGKGSEFWFEIPVVVKQVNVAQGTLEVFETV